MPEESGVSRCPAFKQAPPPEVNDMKKLGFGTMRLPLTDPDNAGSVDLELFKEMVDTYLSSGFSYFDTAWPYCREQSECAVRTALVERYPRDRYQLTDKLPACVLHSFDDRDRIFQEQLRKTGVRYFDYYFLHNINASTLPDFERFDCFGWIKRKKAQGDARHIGFSYHDGPELLDKLLTEHPEFEVVQLQLNYLDWESLGIQSKKCYEVCVKHGKPVFAMEPVKGGTLAEVPEAVEELFQGYAPGRSAASWAIQFAASHEQVQLVLSGMSNLQQLLDNISYMSAFQPLDETGMALVKQAAEQINKQVEIPCTACAYCTEECPKRIAIPQYFSLYNAEAQERKTKTFTVQAAYYENLALAFGKASDCIKCGKCEKHCPQHLPVRNYLEEVAAKFER